MTSANRIPLFQVNMPASVPAAVAAVLNSGQVSDGSSVRAFEEGLAGFFGTKWVLAVSDISAAIQLALFLAGVRPGTEVLAPPMLCVASSMPIANLWAKPRWVDVDANSGMLDPAKLAARATANCKAVLAYHWSGDVADVTGIDVAARALGLKTVEDASDAFGAELDGRRVGQNTADFTAFSFRATKHINSGEGAALVFRDEADFEQARWLRRYGIHQPSFRLKTGDLNPESDIPVAGWNFPLTNFAAAIGVEQLRDAGERVARFQENGRYLDEALRSVKGVELTRRRAGTTSAYWTYSMQVDRRQQFVEAMAGRGVTTQRLHVRNDPYGCFRDADRAVALPGTDVFDARTVSIPCGPWLTDAQREAVVASVRAGW